MKRPLTRRQTDALVVQPITATDRTFPIVFGLEPDVGRALVKKLGIPHLIVGKRMIVIVADVVSAIEAASKADLEVQPMTEPTATVDTLLARLGRTRAA